MQSVNTELPYHSVVGKSMDVITLSFVVIAGINGIEFFVLLRVDMLIRCIVKCC